MFPAEEMFTEEFAWIDKTGEWPTDWTEAEAWVRGSISEHHCPFAWLLGNTFDPIYD